MVAGDDIKRHFERVEQFGSMSEFFGLPRMGNISRDQDNVRFGVVLIYMIETLRQVFCHWRNFISFCTFPGDVGITDLCDEHDGRDLNPLASWVRQLLGKVAGHRVPCAEFAPFRDLAAAAGFHHGTARVKLAAGRGIDRAGDFALQLL